MKIGIVILNYNGQENTLRCLKSLLKADVSGLDLETFLIDNNSSEKLEIHEEEFESINLQIIRNSKNLGFSGGNNIGIEKALSKGSDFILILNNDTILDSKFLKHILKVFDDPQVGIASPKIYFSKGREFHKDRYAEKDLGKVIWYAGGILDMQNVSASHRGVDEVDKGQFDQVSETDFSTGCAMLARREVFEKAGLFDEKYFLYLEDLDFSMRVKRAGYKILFVPNALVWHENAGSTGGSGSSLQDYFITRNRLIFGIKYASIKTKAALFRESIRLLISGRHMQRLGIRDYFMRNLGKGSMNL